MSNLYTFCINVFGNPSFVILSEELLPLAEFANMEKDYVNKVVKNLDAVLEGKMKVYEFGYDATIIDFKPNRSIVNYEYFEKQKGIDSQKIYQLMKDWETYLNQFDKEYEWERSVSNFLGSYFHQDIESPNRSLEEFIQETDENFRLKIIENLNAFLNGDLKDEYKEDYIVKNTDLYFPIKGLEPIEWLKSVVDRLNKIG